MYSPGAGILIQAGLRQRKDIAEISSEIPYVFVFL